jgi:hypothetical protein
VTRPYLCYFVSFYLYLDYDHQVRDDFDVDEPKQFGRLSRTPRIHRWLLTCAMQRHAHRCIYLPKLGSRLLPTLPTFGKYSHISPKDGNLYALNTSRATGTVLKAY